MKHILSIKKEVDLKELDENILPHLPETMEECIVDLSNLTFSKVTTAINILLLLGYLSRHSHQTPILRPPTNQKAVNFLSNMRFFVFAENGLCFVDKPRPIPAPASVSDMKTRRILEIKYIQTNQPEMEFYNRLGHDLHDTVIAKFSSMNNGNYAEVAAVVLELCTNIFDHSRSFGYVAAQEYGETFYVSLGDLGIGIFNAMQSYYDGMGDQFDEQFGPAWDELKALDLAFVPKVSSKLFTRSGTEHESPGKLLNVRLQDPGNGLAFIKNLVKGTGGYLVCRSGNSKLSAGWYKSKWITRRESRLKTFPGTQIEVMIPIHDS